MGNRATVRVALFAACLGAAGLPHRGAAQDERTNSVGMPLVSIPPGEFMMGTPAAEAGREKDEVLHPVRITRPFLLGATEVTTAQWEAVMGDRPGYFPGRRLPVENVSWYDAVAFCQALSEREGLEPAYEIRGTVVEWDRNAPGYRLPTEAEWEYACRVGTTTPYHFGTTITTDQVNYDGNHPPPHTPPGRYRRRPVAAGTLPPNPWGLHEMHGNVWEWCWDWYGPYAEGPVQDPAGPEDGAARVMRGGSWYSFGVRCRSGNRGIGAPESHILDLGFRVARNLP